MYFDIFKQKIWAGVPPLGAGQQSGYIEKTYYPFIGQYASRYIHYIVTNDTRRPPPSAMVVAHFTPPSGHEGNTPPHPHPRGGVCDHAPCTWDYHDDSLSWLTADSPPGSQMLLHTMLPTRMLLSHTTLPTRMLLSHTTLPTRMLLSHTTLPLGLDVTVLSPRLIAPEDSPTHCWLHPGCPGGGGSHIDMVYVYVPAFWGRFFAKFSIAIGGFSSETKEPKFKNLVFFMQIIVKSTQFGQNWVLFYRKWYTDGWVIGRKIGIEIVRFSRFGRHIHVRFWRE